MKERNYGLTANQTQFIRPDLLEKSFNYDVDGCEVFVTRSIIHSPQRLFFVASIVSEWIMEGVKYNELRSWLSSAMETFSDQLLKLSRVFFFISGLQFRFQLFQPNWQFERLWNVNRCKCFNSSNNVAILPATICIVLLWVCVAANNRLARWRGKAVIVMMKNVYGCEWVAGKERVKFCHPFRAVGCATELTG